jgi:oligo-1,6-glucosidase
VNENYVEINVEAQEKDPNSVLNHFRRMAKLRNENKILVYGDYEILQKEHPTVYAYTRAHEGEKWLVLLNFSEETSNFSSPELLQLNEVMINNYDEMDIRGNVVEMKPYQAVILSLEN